MIDRGDIRQAIDRCSNIWASLPGAGYGQFERKGWQPDYQNSKKRAERSERLMWAESPRLSPLWLSASSSACHGLLIITVITPLPTKQRDKNARELKLANAAITDMQMRQRDVAALDAKYTKELADAKAENDALRDDVAAGRRRLHIKAVCQSVREATTASGVDNAKASPTGGHRWTGLFHPQREADHYAKTTGRNPSILMSSADRVAHIDGQLMRILWAIHTRFQRSINA